MKKFVVTLTELVVYKVPVEAETEDDAADAAEEAFVQATEGNSFFHHVEERDATDVEEQENLYPEQPGEVVGSFSPWPMQMGEDGPVVEVV